MKGVLLHTVFFMIQKGVAELRITSNKKKKLCHRLFLWNVFIYIDGTALNASQYERV